MYMMHSQPIIIGHKIKGWGIRNLDNDFGALIPQRCPVNTQANLVTSKHCYLFGFMWIFIQIFLLPFAFRALSSARLSIIADALAE